MIVDEEKARAGHTGDGVRYMLIGGLVMVALALAVSAALFMV